MDQSSGVAPPRPRRAALVKRWVLLPAEIARWGEWYDSKLPVFLAGLCYAGLAAGGEPDAIAGGIGWLVVLFCCYAAFGHIVNDYADREVDRKAGKVRALSRLGEPAALAAVAVPAAGAIAIALWRFDRGTIALTAAALAVAAAYSLPPARLKTRGILGLAAATLAQRTAPMAIAFQSFECWDIAAAAMVVLTTCIGLRFILIHQFLDRDNDLAAGIETVGTRHPRSRLVWFVRRRLAPLEMLCACVAVGAVSWRAPLLLALCAAFVLKEALYLGRGGRWRPVTYMFFSDLYCIVLPGALALSLAVAEPMLAWVVPLAALLAWRPMRYAIRRQAAVAAMAADAEPGKGHKEVTAASPAPAPAAAGFPAGSAEGGKIVDKADPYPFYAELRRRRAVHNMAWPRLGQNWVITRHRDAVAAVMDQRFVCSQSSLPSTARPAPAGPVRGFGPDLLECDPPDHTRLRKLVSKAFTRNMVERFSGRVEQLANQILDEAEKGGSIELISDYATVIPITIIAEILGVQIANVRGFAEFMRQLTMLGPRSPELEATKQRFTNRLQALFAQRRVEPRDDLVTALVKAEQDGDKLSAEELIGMVYLLLLGGFITTANLIGNGTLALIRHRGQMELLRGTPHLAENAVEELLRYHSPLELSSVRFAATEVELDGARIPAGAPIRVLIPAVNRDPDQFADPDALDLQRSPCPHLSFGHGIHYCLGAPLARLEGRIAIPLLVRRFPNLRVANPEEVIWRPHPILRGMARLPSCCVHDERPRRRHPPRRRRACRAPAGRRQLPAARRHPRARLASLRPPVLDRLCDADRRFAAAAAGRRAGRRLHPRAAAARPPVGV
jgi:cytochrome P450 PksS